MKLVARLLSCTIAVALLGVMTYAADNSVKHVSSKHICFISGKRFERTLESVTIEGKSYYYCTSHCLETLKDDPASRSAVDPVSGNRVDKATAVLGQDRHGNVYFFERDTLKKFRVPEPAPAPTGER